MNNENKRKPIILLILKILFVCFTYSLISYFILDPKYDGLSLLEASIRHIILNSIQILIILIIPTFFFICIAKIPKSNRGNSILPYIDYALIVTCVILALSLYGQWIAYERTSTLTPNKVSAKQTSSKQSSEIKPIIATMTIQSSEGVTELDFNQSLLDTFESWTIDTLIKKGKRSIADMGHDPSTYNPKIYADSVYIDVNGKKLAVMKFNLSNVARMVVLIGIKKDQIYRVNCLRQSNHDIPVWSDACGDKIYEAFGVSMQDN